MLVHWGLNATNSYLATTTRFARLRWGRGDDGGVPLVPLSAYCPGLVVYRLGCNFNYFWCSLYYYNVWWIDPKFFSEYFSDRWNWVHNEGFRGAPRGRGEHYYLCNACCIKWAGPRKVDACDFRIILIVGCFSFPFSTLMFILKYSRYKFLYLKCLRSVKEALVQRFNIFDGIKNCACILHKMFVKFF